MKKTFKSLKQGSKAWLVLGVITFPRNIMLFPRICPQSECLHLFHFIPMCRILLGWWGESFWNILKPRIVCKVLLGLLRWTCANANCWHTTVKCLCGQRSLKWLIKGLQSDGGWKLKFTLRMPFYPSFQN